MAEGKITIYLKALIASLFTISMVLYPDQAFQAALDGLVIWWEVVFPALLPFFTAAEILMGLGVVHMMGALLEPLMRPLFKVPGVGAFALAMGFASGYPIGAKITGKLRRDNLCTQIEGERLVSFTNTADPLFMVGAVAVGMFGRPQLGVLLAAAHYISCLLLGLLLRFHGRKSEPRRTNTPGNGANIFSTALLKLREARRKDGRDFGELLGDSIMEAINTLLLIGGFIILFSVITSMLNAVGIARFMQYIFGIILGLFNLSGELLPSLISGTFEISNGTRAASEALAPLGQQVTIASAIIAWSGFSVHAQVASMINDTDIRMGPYIFSRIGHAVLAGLVTVVLLRLNVTLLGEEAISVFALSRPVVTSLNFWHLIFYMGLTAAGIMGILLVISIALHLLRSSRIIIFYR